MHIRFADKVALQVIKFYVAISPIMHLPHFTPAAFRPGSQ